MEMEINGKLSFLDIWVHRNSDGSLRHVMYRKSTHTGIYLNATTCRHPAQKRAGMNTLVHRAFSIADSDFLEQELEYLHRVFSMNGFRSMTFQM